MQAIVKCIKYFCLNIFIWIQIFCDNSFLIKKQK